jgi:hypothetical protein
MVRDLAAELRQQHAYSAKQELDARLPPHDHETMEEFLDKYRRAHPISKFVPQAMQKLEKVSEVIQDYLKTHP